MTIDISPHSYIKDGRLWIHAENGSPLVTELVKWEHVYDSVRVRDREWDGDFTDVDKTLTAVTACVDLEGISPREEDDLPDAVRDFLDDYVGGYA